VGSSIRPSFPFHPRNDGEQPFVIPALPRPLRSRGKYFPMVVVRVLIRLYSSVHLLPSDTLIRASSTYPLTRHHPLLLSVHDGFVLSRSNSLLSLTHLENFIEPYTHAQRYTHTRTVLHCSSFGQKKMVGSERAKESRRNLDCLEKRRSVLCQFKSFCLY